MIGSTIRSLAGKPAAIVVSVALVVAAALLGVAGTTQQAYAAKAVKVSAKYIPDDASWAQMNSSHNDRYVIKGKSNSGKVVWSRTTGKFYTRLGSAIGIRSAGKYVYVYLGKTLTKYKLSNGKQVWTLKGLPNAPETFQFKCLKVSKKGYIYTVGDNGKVCKISPKKKVIWKKSTSVSYMPGISFADGEKRIKVDTTGPAPSSPEYLNS